ncbi:PDR/VanB family oxidoreductase [Janthinobacterium sp. HLX7-2]|uniref:PDR/VanB family oxidoreductase n=1 Tax=Janthinobacterium sp. HLX7-2 TaxID=1259331 RepID=UPI003F28A3A3
MNGAPVLQVRVTAKVCEADDICSFELLPVEGELPPFEAGAHIDVHVRDGLVRQYSLCSRPHERHSYQIGVLREPASRGGSMAMHDEIEVGHVVTIGAPKNHFPLQAAARSLLFAGGIGVTPILAMAEALSAAGADFEMHYSARTPERAAFRARIAKSPFAGRVHFHYDSGDAAQKLDALRSLGAPEPGTHIYVCGPGGYIDHVLASASALGWPPAQVHREYFSAAPVDAGGDAPFDVRLASSGQVFKIPVGRTVVEVLAENGIDIPVSCEQGVCGTCLMRVLDGVPEHRDVYLTDEERAANDQFTPCCSRSKSALLLLDL